jgi:hypothetical protein
MAFEVGWKWQCPVARGHLQSLLENILEKKGVVS